MYSIFDCHCDTITTAIRNNESIYKNSGQLDVERLLAYDKKVQIFAIWLEEKYLKSAFKSTVEAIDFYDLEKSINKVLKPSDIKADMLNGILAIEGGEALEGSIENLEYFFKRGVRLITLTWNNANELGYGACSGISEGLTSFGKKVIQKMNELGMIIDVSHINPKGFFDTLSTTQMPVIASHSNAYKICPHPRNLTDEQLFALRECGGMVGINIYKNFVTQNATATINDLICHIDYIANIIGEDNICIGCDYDGMDNTPVGLEDVSKLKALFSKLEVIYGKNFLNKISYDNMFRFFDKFYTRLEK